MRVGRDRGEVRREEARVLSINLIGVVVCTNLNTKIEEKKIPEDI